MALTNEIEDMALAAGFIGVGITSPERTRGLPRGWVSDVIDLKTPEEVLPSTKSIIMLAFHTWDRAFYMQIESPDWKGFTINKDDDLEGYYVSYMISRTKASPLVSYLREKGYDATLSTRIPMKTTSIKAGIGPQGKNTLLIHPEYGPRLGLMAILTNAELDLDSPYVGDLCGDCTRCLDACPTKALSPYGINLDRCLAYASENPGRDDLPDGVRDMEAKLVVRPTKNSYIECSICANVCPFGQELRRAS